MGNPGDSGEKRLARLTDELASSYGIEALSNRSSWTSMAAILLDGRFGRHWNRCYNQLFNRNTAKGAGYFRLAPKALLAPG